MTTHLLASLLLVSLFSSTQALAGAEGGPSRDPSTFVLFATDGIRARGLRIVSGDIGVNHGGLLAHDTINAPSSTIAGDVVSVGGRSRCAELFFTDAVRPSVACGPGTPYDGPLIPDVAEACVPPPDLPEPDCANAASVVVAAGEERSLPPHVYGMVDVGGAGSRHGRLVLTGGHYVFCGGMRLRRGAALEAAGPTVLQLKGDAKLDATARMFPSDGLPASALEIFSDGMHLGVSRGAEVTGSVCALAATLHVTTGAMLTGRFLAGHVIAGRITLAGLPSGPTTTSTTSSSSTTSTMAMPGTTSTSTVPPTTTSTTTAAVATTSTTTTSTTPPPTTSTTTSSTTTTSTTTSLAGATSTTSSTSTTTAAPTSTTLAGITNCPAGGAVDAIATLVPDVSTFSSGLVGGIEVDLGYPASVSMPGTQFLPVNDPADPATLLVLLSRTPPGVNLYDGLVTFFDADAAAPRSLRTVLTLNQTANLIFNQVVPFERARFTCSPGTPMSVADFGCTVSQEVNSLGGAVPPEGRPPCVLTLAAP